MNDVQFDDTLDEDIWKDSFDKLLDQRPILRQLNVIKRDIRASFNMNSSYENSSYDKSTSIRKECEKQILKDVPNTQQIANVKHKCYLQLPKNIQYEKSMKGTKKVVTSDAVSTPMKNNTTNPFNCTLSPIGLWDLRHFNYNDENNHDCHTNKLKFNIPIIKSMENVENIKLSRIAGMQTKRNTKCSMGASPLVLVKTKRKTKNYQKQVCFAPNKSTETYDTEKQTAILAPELGLQPGKWRKTLNCIRRTQFNTLENEINCTITKKYRKGNSMGLAATTTVIAGQRKSIYLPASVNRKGSGLKYGPDLNNFKLQILQRCGQRDILTFGCTYNEDYLRNCFKIGEGAFGDVYVHAKPKNRHCGNESCEKTVLKIIPIEGKKLVNGEVQKTFEQILPEIIISMELCNLSNANRKTNLTSGFVNLKRVRCVEGCYPSYLQKLWEEYDARKKSDNDHPKCFTSKQQYIVLELAYSGQDLEGFRFRNAEQSFCALKQIILALAVGENEYQFEHRDLHWGNVLVMNTTQSYISYKLCDDVLTIPTKGIRITIIDYTLSRMNFNDYCFYNDLANDEELFVATGDYQFEIYRMMRKVLNNKWEEFEPKTNIYWISYLTSKLVEGVYYKNRRSKTHLQYLNKLKNLQTSILTYKSCMDCVRDVNLF